MSRLVMQRRKLESIDIGDSRVTVVKIKNGVVHLAVDAPQTIPVDRSEVADRKRAEGVLPRRKGGAAA